MSRSISLVAEATELAHKGAVPPSPVDDKFGPDPVHETAVCEAECPYCWGPETD